MLKKEDINILRTKCENNLANKIWQRVLYKVPMIDLIQDKTTTLNQEFNINIKTHHVTDQKSSNRCWIFAGLNILREKVIETCNLNRFELSSSYITFYDKLERFHVSLERLMKYKKAGKDIYDRSVSNLLQTGIVDGGYFSQFANLIHKYGLVPEHNYHETYASSNTYEINQILSRLLRKYYLELEQVTKEEESLKEKYMEKAYQVITAAYGFPPETFDFEYTDTNGDYHIDKDLSPKKFYEKYIGIDLLTEYIEISSYQDERIKYHDIYEELESTRMSGGKNRITLNLSQKEVSELMLKQIKAKEPIYFYCSTTTESVDGVWLDIMERYGEMFGIDLKLDHNSILRTNGITNYHVMIITGAHVINNEVTKWKIENSWGEGCGNQGYYIAYNDWINNYVHRVVINKKYFLPYQLDLLNNETLKIEEWDAKC